MPNTFTSTPAASNQITVVEGTWRLIDLATGTTLAFDPVDVKLIQRRSGGVALPLNGGIANSTGAPRPHAISLAIRTLSEAEFLTLTSILLSPGDLSLSDIYGDAYVCRHASDVEWEHVVSEPDSGETYSVRHHWIARFTVQRKTIE
jgi:hypothetical protein